MHKLIHDTFSKEEIDAIKRVINSNRFSMGPNVKEFESKFADYFNSGYAVCVNSGSSANLIALAALKFLSEDDRDEIIVPAIAWSTTFSPLYFLGFKPIFVDVCRDTFNIDPVEVEKKLSPRTRAIFSVNLLGKSADYKVLLALCKSHNIEIIEDNCEAMGAKFGDRPCGTIGLAGTFSFFYSHHITTIEGGMILTNNREFADICISLRAHGWLRDLDESSKLNDSTVSDFRKLFWFVLPGFNVRPTEFTGAIGIEQLKKFNKYLEARRSNYRHFVDSLEGISDKFYTQSYDDGHSAFSLPIVLKEGKMGARDELVRRLKSAGVETRPIASGDITRHPFIKHFSETLSDNSFKVARYIDDHGFMVGNHPTDLRATIDALLGKLKEMY